MKLPRSRRITRSAEFRQVRECGRSKASRCLVLALETDAAGGPARFGFITPKRLGTAVVRNRIRRRLRAIAREAGPRVVPGLLVVTIARHPAVRASFERLRREWIDLAQRTGILEPEG